jgi:hypothetical protein
MKRGSQRQDGQDGTDGIDGLDGGLAETPLPAGSRKRVSLITDIRSDVISASRGAIGDGHRLLWLT